MDFAWPQDVLDLKQRVRAFVAEHVIPLEREETAAGLPEPLLATARQRAREAGLFLPHMPAEYGGLGLGFLPLCAVFEEAGRSLLGPLALHCSAPDEGNMHLLHRFGSEEQKQRYLRPLAEGLTRSAFALTEPAPGAGADPAMLRTRAVRDGEGWVIDGHRWFATGARGAAFAIVAAVTEAGGPPKDRMTLFLVEAGTPGYEVVRDVPVMGMPAPGGHSEVRFSGCRVGQEQVLGPVGAGFRLLQARLGPARLTHCMRWLGVAQRCLEMTVERARQREAFGARLADHQAVQWMIADSAMDVHASRLMVLDAAWRLAEGDQARVETSMCKAFVAEAVGRVVDRAVQVFGALGFSKDTPLERFYREVRAFRIYDGPSEVHRMVVARALLKRGLEHA